MKYLSLAKHRQLPVALVCAFAPLVLIGCGGGSSPFNPSPTPTTTPTSTTTSTATPTGTVATATPTGTTIATATPTGTTIATATPTGTATPTSTRPSPTATSTPGPTEITVNLTFTKSSDSNFSPATFTTKILDFSTRTNAVEFSGRGSNNGTFLRLNGAVFNPRAGLVYRPTSDDERNFLVNSTSIGGSTSDFTAESGTITVTSFTSNTINLRYDNVVFIADSSTSAKGRVTVNGTINGPYTTDGA